LIGSDYGTVDERLVQSAKLFLDDRLAGRQTVERNLREKMMFCLVLHTAHHQEPEEVLVAVVTASDNLVIHKGHLGVLCKPLLLLVVADEDESGVEAGEEGADEPVEQVGAEVV
jgi:hypothetical protein